MTGSRTCPRPPSARYSTGRFTTIYAWSSLLQRAQLKLAVTGGCRACGLSRRSRCHRSVLPTAGRHSLTCCRWQRSALLAEGEVRLAIELPSHRETWLMLHGEMVAAGFATTAAMAPIEIKAFAAELGLADDLPGTTTGS